MAGFNNFPAIAENLHTALSQVIRKTALDIQAEAQSRAPVDTGFLANSIYAVTDEGSDYGQAGTPPGDSYLFPQADEQVDDTHAFVGVGANYGEFVELGTRFQAAQPFFYPAIDAVQPSFDAALAAIESKLAP